jgi:hypothetical protein
MSEQDNTTTDPEEPREITDQELERVAGGSKIEIGALKAGSGGVWSPKLEGGGLKIPSNGDNN